MCSGRSIGVEEWPQKRDIPSILRALFASVSPPSAAADKREKICSAGTASWAPPCRCCPPALSPDYRAVGKRGPPLLRIFDVLLRLISYRLLLFAKLYQPTFSNLHIELPSSTTPSPIRTSVFRAFQRLWNSYFNPPVTVPLPCSYGLNNDSSHVHTCTRRVAKIW